MADKYSTFILIQQRMYRKIIFNRGAPISRACTYVRTYVRINYYYRIAPNFRGAQFSRISVFRNFAETIFADSRIPLASIRYF